MYAMNDDNEHVIFVNLSVSASMSIPMPCRIFPRLVLHSMLARCSSNGSQVPFDSIRELNVVKKGTSHPASRWRQPRRTGTLQYVESYMGLSLPIGALGVVGKGSSDLCLALLNQNLTQSPLTI